MPAQGGTTLGGEGENRQSGNSILPRRTLRPRRPLGDVGGTGPARKKEHHPGDRPKGRPLEPSAPPPGTPRSPGGG